MGQATSNMDSLDSPRPGLGGSHHLPPYSILCVTLPHLHPNGTFSQDSQNGVPKLSRFGLPGFWEVITPSSDLRLGRGLKQTCSSPQELSNGMSHSTYTHRDRVDSRLLVAVWLPIFLSTITCAVDVQMAHARPFWTFALQDLSNGMKNTSRQGVLTPTIELWVFRESRRTLKSHFRECEWRPHTSLKVGLRHFCIGCVINLFCNQPSNFIDWLLTLSICNMMVVNTKMNRHL
jgi:hypothetical protein